MSVHNVTVKLMDFFVWQGAGGANSFAYSRRVQRSQAEKTQFNVTLWAEIGITQLQLRPKLKKRHSRMQKKRHPRMPFRFDCKQLSLP
jgi:hypothetical protein